MISCAAVRRHRGVSSAAISRQGGQHRVDGKGDGGEQHRDQRDEFALRRGAACRQVIGSPGRSCAAGACAAISSITCCHRSAGCAPDRTYWLAITKVGTASNAPRPGVLVAREDVVAVGVRGQQPRDQRAGPCRPRRPDVGQHRRIADVAPLAEIGAEQRRHHRRPAAPPAPPNGSADARPACSGCACGTSGSMIDPPPCAPSRAARAWTCIDAAPCRRSAASR